MATESPAFSDVIIALLSTAGPIRSSRMRPPAFCILKTLSDGSPHWVEAAQTLEAARAHIELLANPWPGKYIVLNQETGEPVSITAGGETLIP